MNDNISYLYMIYQAVVMGASLLAPATVSLILICVDCTEEYLVTVQSKSPVWFSGKDYNGAERLSVKLYDFMKSQFAKQTGWCQNAWSAFVE